MIRIDKGHSYYYSSLKSKNRLVLLLSDLLVAVFVDIQQKAGKIVTDIRNNRKLEHSYVYCYVVGPYLHS